MGDGKGVDGLGFFKYLRDFIIFPKIEKFRNKAAKYINKSREKKKKKEKMMSPSSSSIKG